MRRASQHPSLSWQPCSGIGIGPLLTVEHFVRGAHIRQIPTKPTHSKELAKGIRRSPDRCAKVICARVDQLVVLGMVIPPWIGNPYDGYINPYYWVDDHPLLYGNNGSWSTLAHIYSISIQKVDFFHVTWTSSSISDVVIFWSISGTTKRETHSLISICVLPMIRSFKNTNQWSRIDHKNKYISQTFNYTFPSQPSISY